MIICRKCYNSFTTSIVLDGKKRSLANRKFCLTCSPFGSRNRMSDDPSKKPLRLIRNGKVLAISDEHRRQQVQRYVARNREIKTKLVQIKGGKCQNCGYNRCLRALTFHHRNPKQKKFELGRGSLGGRSWSAVLAEATKCDLLCANCHAELHDSDKARSGG
jgi:hypothetical protein